MTAKGVEENLSRLGVLPPVWSDVSGTFAWSPSVDYPPRYRGSLLAGAAGDALGRPAETLPPSEVARRFGQLRDFRPWEGWAGGPVGTITDDTQLTMVVAHCLLANGDIEPTDLARRLVRWRPQGRGMGEATTRAVLRLAEGIPWWEAGEHSDGNGAAMRAGPVGLAFAADPDRLRRAASLSAVVTHTGPMAVVGAVAQAGAVALALHTPPGSLDPPGFVKSLADFIEDLHDPGAFERRPDAAKERVRLADRVRELPDMLNLSPSEAFARLYNGAFVLESLPSALWCFLHTPDDLEEVLVTAVSGGRDADTVAAMAGTIAGAYLGEVDLPRRWLQQLEFADELREMADGLYLLAKNRAAPNP